MDQASGAINHFPRPLRGIETKNEAPASKARAFYMVTEPRVLLIDKRAAGCYT